MEWLEQQRMEARRDKVTAERHVAEAKAAQRAAVRAVAEAWVARCGRPHDQEGGSCTGLRLDYRLDSRQPPSRWPGESLLAAGVAEFLSCRGSLLRDR